MKKLLSVLLALMMIIGTLALVSCGPKPELDIDAAAKALEKADYDVDVDDEFSNPSIEKRLSAESEDGKDYIYIVVYKDTKSAKLAYEDQKMSLDQYKEEIKLKIETYEHLIDEYESDLKSDEINSYKDKIKDYEKTLEEMDEYVIGRSGKTIWYGTEKAVEATKG